jgi:hypothetical protein
MPDQETLDHLREDQRQGKSPSTQAGEFVRQEIDHIREGKHGARSPEQAIAIGLSEARRAGVKLPPPKKGAALEATRKKAAADERHGQSGVKKKPSAKRSRATEGALKREGHSAASHGALGKHARTAAKKRTAAQRSASAKKAARTRARER